MIADTKALALVGFQKKIKKGRKLPFTTVLRSVGSAILANFGAYSSDRTRSTASSFNSL